MLEDLRRIISRQPWCILEDFNAVLHPHERLPLGQSSAGFMNWAYEDSMKDMGFTGPSFTWNHGNCVA